MLDALKPYPNALRAVPNEPWLGAIPEHWSVARMKHVLAERNERGFPAEPLLAATQTKGVVLKSDYGTRTVEAMKDLHLLKLVRVGDFVISLRSFQGGIEHARNRGIISPAYTILYPRDSAAHGYLAALFKSRPFIGNLTLYVTGIRQGQNIDYVKLSRSYVPLPPPAEQAGIVRFLGAVDRKVNRFIRAKRRLIEVLTEQKQAIITHAVTRGLNPDAPLKPSGIDWLIPEHWDMLRAKYLFREVDERSVTGEELHLSMSQRHGLVQSDTMEERRLLSESYVGGKLCRNGDLVLNRLKAHLGVFAVAPQPGVISPDYTVLRPLNRANVYFYELLLRSNKCRPELRRRAKGIVQGFWRLYTDDFYDIRLPVPSLTEQAEIIAACDASTREINSAIETILREIDLIREYRTRLVADVVTGKLDVRGVTLPAEAGEEAADSPLPLHQADAEASAFGDDADDQEAPLGAAGDGEDA